MVRFLKLVLYNERFFNRVTGYNVKKYGFKIKKIGFNSYFILNEFKKIYQYLILIINIILLIEKSRDCRGIHLLF